MGLRGADSFNFCIPASRIRKWLVAEGYGEIVGEAKKAEKAGEAEKDGKAKPPSGDGQ